MSTWCVKCGNATGPVFAMCADCVRAEDRTREEEMRPCDDPDSPEANAHDKKLTDADRAGVTSIKPRRSHRMRGWNRSE